MGSDKGCKRIANKGILNGLNHIAALLTHTGNVTANSTEGLGSRLSTKGAGDFLFDLWLVSSETG